MWKTTNPKRQILERFKGEFYIYAKPQLKEYLFYLWNNIYLILRLKILNAGWKNKYNFINSRISINAFTKGYLNEKNERSSWFLIYIIDKVKII